MRSTIIIMPFICPKNVLDGHLYTKDTRIELYGKVAGGGGSTKPEKFQREQIENGTCKSCPKTNIRINWRKNELEDTAHPMTQDDGFDYTEDFDGKQTFDQTTVYINLKSVVGVGGSQTRTLRDECYAFINSQLNYLVKSGGTDVLFANIFDGDEAARRMPKFAYLLELPEFISVKKYVYVGDLKGYFAWVGSRV
jgi:hypothetical protein